MKNYFVIGLDLGQAQDYTALAVIECLGGIYHVRHLERFRLGTFYPVIVERVAGLLDMPALGGNPTLVVDATGVGAPVVDMLRASGLSPIAVTITSGDSVQPGPGGYRVPKRDLVTTVQVLLQSGKLKFAEGLPEVSVLVKELLAFQIKITDSAHDVYGTWREGVHDDLVLGLSLACWFAKMKFQGWAVGMVARNL